MNFQRVGIRTVLDRGDIPEVGKGQGYRSATPGPCGSRGEGDRDTHAV